jgi:hypothetical protein
MRSLTYNKSVDQLLAVKQKEVEEKRQSGGRWVEA